MTFRYFYGNEADQYSFYRIPKLLFKNEYFKKLSSDAKILYGLMLNCGRNKAVKSLQELDDENGIDLIEKRRQEFGKANIIYAKSFMVC